MIRRDIDPDQLHGCPSQKTVYATREDALEDRRRIRASYDRARLYVYRCDRCDQYHLSSQKHQAVTRRMRQWDNQEQRQKREWGMGGAEEREPEDTG